MNTTYRLQFREENVRKLETAQKITGCSTVGEYISEAVLKHTENVLRYRTRDGLPKSEIPFTPINKRGKDARVNK